MKPRILLRLHHGLGDILCALPAIKAYKEKHDCILHFHCIQNDLLANLPYIDCVINSRNMSKQQKRSYDKIINLQWDTTNNNFLNMHLIEMFANQLNVIINDRTPEIILTKEERESKFGFDYAVFHTQSGWHSRNWPVNKFIKVAKYVDDNIMPVVEVGQNTTPMGIGRPLIDQTGIRDLMSIVYNAQLFVGVDSFVAHLAGIFKVPSVSIWGSTSPKHRIIGSDTYPIINPDEKCIGCHHHPSTKREKNGEPICIFNNYQCIWGIPADIVIDKIKTLFPSGSD